MVTIQKVTELIKQDKANRLFTEKGWEPILLASQTAKILIIGQAPGIITQEKQTVFQDKSGDNLREWLGVSADFFYQSGKFAVLPMDFYFPGKGVSGDLPPREAVASKWHPRLMACMPDIGLTLLVGAYAQKFYLKEAAKRNLTETVYSYQDYLPLYFPLPHPSPRNNIWQSRNPLFKDQILPDLKLRVHELLYE